MGPSPSTSTNSQITIESLFPHLSTYKPLRNNEIQATLSKKTYKHETTGQIASIRSCQIRGNQNTGIENYYKARKNLKNNSYVFQLIDTKQTPSNSENHKIFSIPDQSYNLCSVKNLRSQQQMHKNLWLFVQSSNHSLEDQIVNRQDKKAFQEVQLWSVLATCVFGAISLLENGFKEPVLSPKGICLSEEGVIKVGEWQFVSKVTQSNLFDEGQILFGKSGYPIRESNRNSLNQILMNYYWAPEGLKAMQEFVSLGQRQNMNKLSSSVSNKRFQVFSLGLTLISMCLRNFYYRSDTFSEKYLNKLTNQAFEIRQIEGKCLSEQLKFIIESMVKWDIEQRINYSQLHQLIIQYFNNHPEEGKNSTNSFQSFSLNQTLDLDKKGAFTVKDRPSVSNMNVTLPSWLRNFNDSCTLSFPRRNDSPLNNNPKNSLNYMAESFGGSGAIQQGSGDNDENLQTESEDTFFEEYEQTQKQKEPNYQMPKNEKSPKTSKIERKNICPHSTPYDPNQKSRPSGLGKSNEGQRKIQQSLQVKGNPEGYQNCKDCKETSNIQYPYHFSRVDKKMQLDISSINCQEEKAKSDGRLKSLVNSSRGSYRSFNKQPPNISSGRVETTNKQNLLFFKSPRSNAMMPFSGRQGQNELLYPISKMQPDIQDIQDGYPYLFLLDSNQVQNPDLFMTEYEQLENSSIKNQESIILIRVKQQNFDQNREKLFGSDKDALIRSEQRKQSLQYMTFNINNEKLTLEESFHNIEIDPLVVSKWNKRPSKQIQRNPKQLVLQRDDNLFTDPKLLEYIKSPIHNSNGKSYSFSSNEKNQQGGNFFSSNKYSKESNRNEYPQKIQPNIYSATKENYNIQASAYQGLTNHNNFSTFNKGQQYNNFQPSSSQCKIVREKVTKGFYEGEKRSGLRSGYGVFYYNEGGKYKGNWLNNMMHGKGTLQYADGRIAYQGDWNCDELHGKGILYNQSPNFISNSLNYKDLDQLDQCWIFYEGKFEHDDKSGMGLLVLSNQQQFIGQFKDDMAEGIGQYVTINGKVIKGIWSKNKLVSVIEQKSIN